jgi:hypothetical protein
MFEKFVIRLNEALQEYVVTFYNSEGDAFSYYTGSTGEMRRLLDDTIKVFYGRNLYDLHFREALDDWLDDLQSNYTAEKTWNFDILIGVRQYEESYDPDPNAPAMDTWDFSPEEILEISSERHKTFPSNTVMQFIEVPQESSKVVDLLSLIPF